MRNVYSDQCFYAAVTQINVWEKMQRNRFEKIRSRLCLRSTTIIAYSFELFLCLPWTHFVGERHCMNWIHMHTKQRWNKSKWYNTVVFDGFIAHLIQTPISFLAGISLQQLITHLTRMGSYKSTLVQIYSWAFIYSLKFQLTHSHTIMEKGNYSNFSQWVTRSKFSFIKLAIFA